MIFKFTKSNTFKKLLSILPVFVLIFSESLPVINALSPQQKAIYTEGINFFDVGTCNNSTPSGPAASSGATINNSAAQAIAQKDSTGGTNVGYALYDSTGKLVANYNDTFENYGASITKSMLLVAYLNQVGSGPLSSTAQNELTSMIENSDNASANWVYSQLNDGPSEVKSVASSAGMSGFEFNTSDPTYVLGQSRITANDFAKFFSKIDTMISSSQKSFGLNLLSNLSSSDQNGLLQAGLPGTVYSKEGWKPEDSGSEGAPYIVNQAAQFSSGGTTYGVAVTVGGTSDQASGEAIVKNVVSALVQTSGNQASTPGSCCNPGGTPTTPGTPVAASQVEKQNAETIIGIAKTENLGQSAALIGLMVGDDESTLTNLANSKVPLSESNPNKQGDGSNGTSLGVFQQQITDGWSTISSSISDTGAIAQLMTPAYAAEAFFGSPSGSNAPSALSKGLQNVSGWQTMKPWVAAQAVQHSGTSDGSNYERYLSDAQSLLTQYWNSAPPVSLPVSFSGAGSGSPGSPDSCSASSQGGTIVQEALKLAWPEPFANKTSSETTRTNALSPSPAYQAALTQYYPGAPFNGADCGTFVGTVMRASGADPNYPPSGTVAQMTYVLAHPDKYQIVAYKVTDTSVLQPGDILIINQGTQYDSSGKITVVGNGAGAGGHTFIWLGSQGTGGYTVAAASEDSYSAQLENMGDTIVHDPLGRGYFLAVRYI